MEIDDLASTVEQLSKNKVDGIDYKHNYNLYCKNLQLAPETKDKRSQ